MHTCTGVKNPTKFGVNWSHFNFGTGMGCFRLGGDTSTAFNICGWVRTDNLGNLHSYKCVSQIYIYKNQKSKRIQKSPCCISTGVGNPHLALPPGDRGGHIYRVGLSKGGLGLGCRNC